jgi:capsular polysaccharide export protein
MFHYVDRPNAAGAPRILLLQGPVGPFFCDLQSALIAKGFQTKRVVFNVGDRLFASPAHTVPFTGSLDDWAQWLRRELRENWPDFIVLFGAMRPVHTVAKKLRQSTVSGSFALKKGIFGLGL